MFDFVELRIKTCLKCIRPSKILLIYNKNTEYEYY